MKPDRLPLRKNAIKKQELYRSMKWISLLITILLGLNTGRGLYAQHRNAADSILLGAIVVGNDTIPMVFLEDVEIMDKLPRKWVKKKAEYDRLRHNVYVTYPYAVIAAGVLNDVYQQLEFIPDKKARKKYMKEVEKELKAKFKGELENLTISQGQVLVKLINRQTGRNCYSIIKEVKGGFNAVVYQSVALLFNNNLKKAYDPSGNDRDIEMIVQELEAANYYRYQYYLQQRRQMQSRSN